MPTRPPTPDPTGAHGDADKLNPFAGLGAGLGFVQDWMKAAGSALPNLPGNAGSALSGASAWSMPSLDPEEIDKRIRDLKTVQFWLEQNGRMIGMTIQGLEVQRMTLSTLKGMNVSMDTLRDSLKARTAPMPQEEPSKPASPSWMHRPSSAASPAPQAPEAPSETDAEPASTPDAPDLVNPMRWWDTLSQQFTHLASQAAQTTPNLASMVKEQTAASMKRATDTVASAVSAASKAQQAATQAATAAMPPSASGKTAKPSAKVAAKKASAPRRRSGQAD